MYNTIKKLSLSFIFINVFMFQSLMADMMFYYSAAILPSINASKSAASPICPPKVVLDNADGAYNAIVDNLSFSEQDGRRIFEAELDNSKYVIDETFYTDEANISTMNPMYFVYYEDMNITSYVRAELEISEVNIESNMTWNYQENRVENINGFKMSETEEEGGTWTSETDGSITLSIDTDPIFNVKPIRVISQSEINTMLVNAGINIPLSAGDTGQLNLAQELEDWYWWNDQSYIDQNFTTYEEAISTAKYNSNNPHQTIVLWGDRGYEGVGITFAADSTGMSGTLVEVSNDNKLLSSNAGTWSLETITDDGDTYEVVVLNPILCGYRQALFKLNIDGQIIQGEHSDVAGELTAELVFSESLKDKLKAYFEENAILDVEPDPVVDYVALLGGKTFYIVESDYIDESVFDANVTSLSWTEITPGVLMPESGVDSLVADPTKVTIIGDAYFVLAEETPDYLVVNVFLLDGTPDGETRFYFDQAVATAYYESLQPTPIDYVALLGGKTFYSAGVDYDDQGAYEGSWLDSIVFNADVTSVTWETIGGDWIGDTGTEALTPTVNRVTFTDSGDYLILVEENNDSILVNLYLSDGTPDGQEIWYFDQGDAEAYLDSLQPDLETIMVGNTFYQRVQDIEQVPTEEWIAEMTADANGTLVVVDNGVPESKVYTIDGNTITVVSEEGTRVSTLTALTDTYLEFDNSLDGTWYFTRALAEAAPAVIW